MGLFDRLDRMASAAVDRVNAVRFVLTPMKSTPNGRPAYDDDRPIVEGYGIFDLDEHNTAIELGNRDRRGNDLRSLVTGLQPVLSVDRRYFPTAADEPHQGDRVEFPGRSGMPAYSVVSVARDGISRLVIKLVA